VTVQIDTDRQLIMAETRSTRHAVVQFAAPQAASRHARLPVNVAIVLDRSGSMAGQKIVLARQAVEAALALLRPEDRFAFVIYDDVVEVVTESRHATSDAVASTLIRLATIEPRRGTNLGGGWLLGCEQVAKHLGDEALGRCLLVTDGLANVGMCDPAELCRHAAELRHRGIATSTFGVGTDFDERLLRKMSDAGAGHFYYVETPAQIEDALTGELGEALEVVAREVSVDLVTSVPARIDVLNDFRIEQVPSGVRCHVGDLVSGQALRLAASVLLPPGPVGAQAQLVATLRDREGVLGAATASIRWTYASHADDERHPRNRIVDRVVANLHAHRARRDALELNRRGRLDEAGQVLEAAAVRVRLEAGDDTVLLGIAAELSREHRTYTRRLSAAETKERFFSQYSSLRERDEAGRSRRTLRPDRGPADAAAPARDDGADGSSSTRPWCTPEAR
jgi:Ca-activated chloride channel family protein